MVEKNLELSRREMEIAREYAAGRSYRDIANKLNIAPATVRTHLSTIYRKLDVANKVELANLLGANSDVEHLRKNGTRRYLSERRLLSLVTIQTRVAASSTELEDPEVFDMQFRAFREKIEAQPDFGGRIVEQGPRICIAYGWPKSNENDAERALNAALHLAQELSGTDETLTALVSLVTGNVLVGGTTADPEFTGHATVHGNELLRLAQPGSVVIDEMTRRLVGDLFDVVLVDGEGAVFSATARAAGSSRFAALRFAHSMPFVGRKRELQLLRSVLGELGDGRGQAVLISGDAGIGKSRLVNEVISGEGGASSFASVALQGEPDATAEPFKPALDWARNKIIERAGHPPRTPRDVATHLLSAEASEFDILVFSQALDMATGKEGPLAAMSPERMREETIRVLADSILAAGSGKPMLLVIEDLHWVDASTRTLVERLAALVAENPLLIFATSRPFSDGREVLAGALQLSLRPLTEATTAELAASFPAMSEHAVRDIVARADGVPLYAEELAFSITQARAELVGNVPASLTQSLTARLDALGTARQLALLAAVMGRRFETDLLADAWDGPGDAVQQMLRRSVELRLIEPSGTGYYAFRHALMRDACYASLPTEARQRLHASVAERIERRSNGPSAELARHTELAGSVTTAIGIWIEVIGRLIAASSNVEALQQAEHALALLDQLTETTTRETFEAVLRLQLGVALQALEGYASDRIAENYARAEALCDAIGDQEMRFSVKRGLFVYNLLAGKLRRAHQLALELIDLAETTGHPIHLVEAKHAMGEATIFHRTDLRRGVQLLDEAVEIYDIRNSGEHIRAYAQDPAVFSKGLSLFALVALGEFARTETAIAAVQSLAGAASHPLSQAAAHVFSAWAAYLIDQKARALEFASAAERIGHDQRLPPFEFWGNMVGRAITGQLEGAEQQLAFYDFSGVKFTISITIPLIAERALDEGEVDLSWRMIERPLLLLEGEEYEPCMSVEVCRVAGRIAHARNRAELGARLFERAWERSELTDARYFAIRAALDALACGEDAAVWRPRLSHVMGRLGTGLPASVRSRVERAVGPYGRTSPVGD